MILQLGTKISWIGLKTVFKILTEDIVNLPSSSWRFLSTWRFLSILWQGVTISLFQLLFLLDLSPFFQRKMWYRIWKKFPKFLNPIIIWNGCFFLWYFLEYFEFVICSIEERSNTSVISSGIWKMFPKFLGYWEFGGNDYEVFYDIFKSTLSFYLFHGRTNCSFSLSIPLFFSKKGIWNTFPKYLKSCDFEHDHMLFYAIFQSYYLL